MTTQGRTGATEYAITSDTEVTITRVFDAPKRVIWDAWTSCEHLPNWMLGPEGWTMPICEIDLRPGGALRMVWRRTDATEMEITGVYREVEPPERLVYVESWQGDWPETTDTLLLSETDGKTTATVTIRYVSKEARDAALATGGIEGLSRGFDRLDDYLPTLG